MANLRINIKRLESNLSELGKIGRNDSNGIDRAFGTDSDINARKWLEKYWRKLGGTFRTDYIANLWLDMKGEDNIPKIVIGSHHDAVPNGGMFDGALGVLIATELYETIKENHIKLRHPFSIISFTGEEPNEFNVSTLGSKVMSGRLVKSDLSEINSFCRNLSLASAVEKAGGDIKYSDSILVMPGEISAFIEIHNEQGKRLENEDKSVAVVECITGIYREIITVTGEANHAGTTVMGDRFDALTAASEYILGVERILKDFDDDELVATIGYIDVNPNSANIIPGQVKMIMDLRFSDNAKKQKVISAFDSLQKDISDRRKVKLERFVNLDQPYRNMHHDVIEAIEKSMQQLGQSPKRLTSMAGHDAANMAIVTRSGMIFVKSKDGKSHCPEEFSAIEDIEIAANVALLTLLELDKGLDF